MKKGFTLVEILTAISILVIIGMFMTTGYLSMIRLNQQAIIDRRNIHEASVNFAHKDYLSLKMIDDELSITFSLNGKKVTKNVAAYQDETTGLVYYQLKEESHE